MLKPNYARLDNVYSESRHSCSLTMDNQCAIRVSRALIKAGWPKSAFKSASYTGKVCPHGYARGAQDLAAYLSRELGFRSKGWSRPGSVPGGASGVHGIICFMNIPGYGGQGHIDLWDGQATRTGSYWNSETIWLWSL